MFGGQLIAVDKLNTLNCWEISTQELVSTIEFGLQSFQISSIVHPATYINKILLGSTQGQLQLWNLSKSKLVYQFSGWDSCVNVLIQAPALHIMAVGHESGLIVLHHLQNDCTLMKFSQEWGPVHCLSFRTDDAAVKPLLISASNTTGHLAVWNLGEQRLETQMRDIHQGSVVGCSFINKQPLLITNSMDNSLKIFVFDDLQTNGRLLFQRDGHRRPPTKIRFHGDRGHYIISAGLDSTLKAFSIYSERLNRNFGTASYNRKLAKKKGVHRDTNIMNPIIDFSIETVREKEWDNIVACHRNTPFVTSWNFDRMKMGEHRLMHDRFRNQTNVFVECVSLSVCGNFAFVGTNTGHLDRFNIQSGIHRCQYGDPAHQGIIRGVVSDDLNQMVVSGGNDCRLQFWRFSRNELIGTFKLTDSASQLCLHKENSLLAVALDNFHVIIVDLETKKVVRRFIGHTNRITDMSFDPDCRRLFVSSMDSRIYVWDMLSGHLVDLFSTQSPCVSLTISPTGEFLATSHVNDVGIYLWSNISIYSTVTLKPLEINDDVPVIQLPQIRSDELDQEGYDQSESDETAAPTEEENDSLIEYEYCSPQQISTDLITLSTLAHSRWKNLLNLDLIKKRNKPIEPIVKPKSAPFFLPTISGLKPQFDINKDNKETLLTIEENQITKQQIPLHMLPEFARLLLDCTKQDNYVKVFEQLKTYGPSKIDAELRSIGPDTTGSNEFLLQFLNAMHITLATNVDFELIQSYLGLFYKIHIDTITTDRSLLEKCQSIALDSGNQWNRLSDHFDRSLCLINYLRNALL